MEWMRDRKGFPAPDRKAFHEIEPNPDPRTLHDAIEIWVEALRDALGDQYEIVDSDRFVAISGGAPADTDALLLLMERAQERLKGRLREMAHTLGPKPLVLLFDSAHRFNDYVAAIDDENVEQFGTAAYIPGWPATQFAFAPAPLESYGTAILHALTHSMTGDTYPYWVREVVAAYATDPPLRDVSGDWTEETIRDFWNGQSFFDDDRREASYALAARLAEKLSVDDVAFRLFLRTAHWRDLGEAAARQAFGMGVGDCVALVIGHGNWAPLAQPLE